MVWNGISVDLSRLAGSGRNERPDLRFVAFRDVGRNSFYGIDGIWGWSTCGLCGGDFKSTSLGNLDASGRGLKGTVVFRVVQGKERRWVLSHPLILGISSKKKVCIVTCLRCQGTMLVERQYTRVSRRFNAKCINCGFWFDLADVLRFFKRVLESAYNGQKIRETL